MKMVRISVKTIIVTERKREIRWEGEGGDRRKEAWKVTDEVGRGGLGKPVVEHNKPIITQLKIVTSCLKKD